MGFFKKRLAGSIDSHSGELNAFLGAGTEYRGRLDFVGTVRIDGVFHGEIVSEGVLVLGREATVHGQVSVGTLYSNGTVVGDVVASNKAVLQQYSALEGSLRAPALVVEEGAALEGNVEMSAKSVAVEATSVPPLEEAEPEVLMEDEAEAVEAAL